MLTGLRKVVVLPAVPIFKCHLPENFLRLNLSSNSLVLRQMIPYARPKLSDFYTLFESKLAENHTLHSGTYLYSSYMGVPPPPRNNSTVGIELGSPYCKCSALTTWPRCLIMIGRTKNQSRCIFKLTESYQNIYKSFSYWLLVFLDPLRLSVDGCVLKPVQRPPKGEREVVFYEAVFNKDEKRQEILELRRFLPHYHGIVELGILKHAISQSVDIRVQTVVEILWGPFLGAK